MKSNEKIPSNNFNSNICYITYPDGKTEEVFKSDENLAIFGIVYQDKIKIEEVGWVTVVGVTKSGELCVDRSDGVRVIMHVKDKDSLKKEALEIDSRLKPYLALDGVEKVVDIREEKLVPFGVRYNDRINFKNRGWATVIGVYNGELWVMLDKDGDRISYYKGIANKEGLSAIAEQIVLLGEAFYLSEMYGLFKIITLSESLQLVFKLVASKEEPYNVNNALEFTHNLLKIDDPFAVDLRSKIISKLWISVIKNDLQLFKSTLSILYKLNEDNYDIKLRDIFYHKFGALDLLGYIYDFGRIDFLIAIINVFKDKILIPIDIILESIKKQNYDLVMLFLENQLLATKTAYNSDLKTIFPLMRAIPQFIEAISTGMFENRIYEQDQLPAPIFNFYNDLFIRSKNDKDTIKEIRESFSNLILAYLKKNIKLKKYSEISKIYPRVEYLLSDTDLLELFKFIIKIVTPSEATDLYHPGIEREEFSYIENVCLRIRAKLDKNEGNNLFAKLYIGITRNSLKSSKFDQVDLYFAPLSKFCIINYKLLSADNFIEIAEIKQNLADAQYQNNLIDIHHDNFTDNDRERYFRTCILKTILTYYKIAKELSPSDNQILARYKHLEEEFDQLNKYFTAKQIEIDNIDFEAKPLLMMFDEENNKTAIIDNNNNTSYSTSVSSGFINSPLHQHENDDKNENKKQKRHKTSEPGKESESNTKPNFGCQ